MNSENVFVCPPDHKHGDTSTCRTRHKCRCADCRARGARDMRAVAHRKRTAHIDFGAIPADWVVDAACVGEPAELFFPELHTKNEVAYVKSICRACPVVLACRLTAIKNNEEYGVWGGMTPKERDKYLREKS